MSERGINVFMRPALLSGAHGTRHSLFTLRQRLIRYGKLEVIERPALRIEPEIECSVSTSRDNTARRGRAQLTTSASLFGHIHPH
jgi:hypothetical protein